MSEQALKPAISGNGSATGAAATGTFAALTPGKQEPEAGKALPVVAAIESPDVESLVQELNIVSRSVGRDLRFEVDLERGIAVIQVLDSETGELIRQIPHDAADIALNSNGKLNIRLIDAVI